MITFPSTAVRLCQVALEKGVDIRGSRFLISGEPVTEMRLASIRRVGGNVATRYGMSKAGWIGTGCLAPDRPDEQHVLHDFVALIRAESAGADRGLPANALLASSLYQTSPFVLLNVSTGDQATISERSCGCPMEKLGWPSHLHTIRSLGKLTSGGMSIPQPGVAVQGLPVPEPVLGVAVKGQRTIAYNG